MDDERFHHRFAGSIAERYERDFVPAVASRVAPRLVDAAALHPGDRVLDLACGTGVVARIAAARVGPTGHVEGVDASPEMIDVARTVPVPDGASVDWHVADAVSLPFSDGSIDAVLCQMALMLMEEPAAALLEARRVLAPGGRLAASTPGAIQPPLAILDECIARHVDEGLAGFVRTVFSMHDPDAMATLLAKAGYREIDVTVLESELRLPPPREFLWQYLGATPLSAPVSAAPAEARAALEEEVVARWQDFVESGAIVMRQPMVVATALA